MKELLIRYAELSAEHDRDILQSNLADESKRSEHYSRARKIIAQQQAILATVQETRRRLVLMAAGLLKELEEVSQSDRKHQFAEMIKLAGELLAEAYSDHGFVWEELRRHFRDYHVAFQALQATPDYTIMLTNIEGDSWTFLHKYCEEHRTVNPFPR